MNEDAASFTIMFVGLGFFLVTHVLVFSIIIYMRRSDDRSAENDWKRKYKEAKKFGFEGSRLQKEDQ